MSYLIGIDIAKYKHDCFIMTSDGEIVRESFSFPNNVEGYKTLKAILDGLDNSLKIKIGLETTGHYGKNLKSFLIANGYEYTELNPYLVKKYIQTLTLCKNKTDNKDMWMFYF